MILKEFKINNTRYLKYLFIHLYNDTKTDTNYFMKIKTERNEKRKLTEEYNNVQGRMYETAVVS
jgi:hypothetical protein